mgnify:CR=1 FL=1
MVYFNKKLKIDRIALFVKNVTEMGNNTPADGYMIGDAVNALPDNLKQFLLSEIPDNILRKEYARRNLHKLDDVALSGLDEIKDAFVSEVYTNNELHTVAELLGTDALRPDLIETVEALIKLFPERWTLDDLLDVLQSKAWGL